MNAKHQPVMLGLEVLKTSLDHKGSTYPKGVCPPLDGIVPAAWMPLVPSTPHVKILPKNGGWIKLSPFDPLPEPENVDVLSLKS